VDEGSAESAWDLGLAVVVVLISIAAIFEFSLAGAFDATLESLAPGCGPIPWPATIRVAAVVWSI
jgi:hypothetical protein